MSEKKRTVRKREFVIQKKIKAVESTATRVNPDATRSLEAWEDVTGGFADAADAKRGIRNGGYLGKFRIIAVCEEVEAKEVTEKKIVFG